MTADMNQDEWYRMTLRIPPEIHKHLKENAEKHNRALTAEILKRLFDTIELEKLKNEDLDLSIKDGAEKISAIAKQIALLSEGTSPAKLDLLTTEEIKLLKCFNDVSKSEKELLIKSLPDLISLVKKMR